MSSRQREDQQERRRAKGVASYLGISVEALEQHPYEIERTPARFAGYSWRVVWQDTPPPGVKVEAASGTQWTYIAPFDSEDE